MIPEPACSASTCSSIQTHPTLQHNGSENTIRVCGLSIGTWVQRAVESGGTAGFRCHRPSCGGALAERHDSSSGRGLKAHRNNRAVLLNNAVLRLWKPLAASCITLQMVLTPPAFLVSVFNHQYERQGGCLSLSRLHNPPAVSLKSSLELIEGSRAAAIDYISNRAFYVLFWQTFWLSDKKQF